MPDPDVTQMLQQAGAGDPRAAERLLPLVYDELRRLADARLRRTPPGHTLQATALVHEAYLKLVGSSDPGWDHRGHFFAAAAQAMREILVDHARRKGALKRGGDRLRLDADPDDLPAADRAADVLALESALERLEALDPRKARVVVLRFYGGLTHEQIAAVLGTSPRTVEREWRFARSWLKADMQEGEAVSGGDTHDGR